ncbi:MAG: MATE family efflux transporter [Eubacteriales bacterium]|nr:MATE family efflux transporter [Eubacteriales bacterium]
MNTKSKHEIDMLNGSLLPKILEFSIPLVLSSVLQLLFNAADVMVVGQFVGSNALAAISSTGSFTALLTNFFIGLSVGVNVVAATNYAAGKYKDVNRVVHTSIGTSLISGLVLMVINYFLSEPVLSAMGSPKEVLPLSVLYLRILFAGMPFQLLYNFGSAILRSIGDTKRPLKYLTVAGVVNVILNLVAVIVFKLGVAGVAIATVASHVVSSLLIVKALMEEDSCLKLDLRRLNLDLKIILKFGKIGIPAGLQSVLFAVSNVLIQSSVNSFGSIVMAGNGVAANIEGFQYAAMHSIYSATITFAGQNLGAKKYSRLNKIYLNSFLCVCIVSVPFIIAYNFFGRELMGLYTSDIEVINAGMVRLGLFALTYIICGFMDVASGMMRGLGYGTSPTVITLLGAVGFRLFWIFFIFPVYHDYYLLLVSYPISWAITTVVFVLYYRYARSKLPKGDET